MDNIERAKELLENKEYIVDNKLTHMEILNLFEAVAKRCGTTLTLCGTHESILIGNFKQLTEAMFESEFKLILERSNCGYDGESEDWYMFT
jgi:hypothetical protein